MYAFNKTHVEEIFIKTILYNFTAHKRNVTALIALYATLNYLHWDLKVPWRSDLCVGIMDKHRRGARGPMSLSD